MNRISTLSVITIAAFLATPHPSAAQLKPANTGTITMETNLDARGSFEALAQRAGLNVVTRSLPSTGTVPFKIENRSVTEALDLLTKQTNTFWTPFDSKTILVLPETQQHRRDYDRQYVHRIPVDRPAAQVLQELRTTHQFRGVVSGTGNTILLKDVKPRLSLAESLLGSPSTPIGGEALANVYLTEASPSLRTPVSVRSQLKIRVPGPVSLNVNESGRATFETLARMSGVNLIFGRTYPNRTHSFRIDGVNYFDALDLLAFETGSFWQPVNETTIVVYEDTQQNRRDYGSQLIETIYLSPGISVQKLNEIMNSLRTLLSLRGVYQSEPANAILIRDTTANVVLVEAMVEEMSGAPIRKEIAASILEAFSETGGSFRTSADVRSKLKTRVAGTVSLRMNAPINAIFENLTTMAGLDLLFAATPRSVAFNVENQNIVDALDFLAFQGGYFWQPLDDRTIQVLEDTQQNRRDYETHIVKTLYLPPSTPTNELNQIMNVLRTALSLRGVYQNENAKAILVKDTPARVALTERIVRQLNVQPGEVTSSFLSVPGATETTVRVTASTVRAELKVTNSTPVSINLNQDVRASYELLGQMAGLRVTFDPRVVARGPVPLNLTGADILDALTYLALQTQTFWNVVDAQTILVAPDTRQVHDQLDPRISRTIYLTNARTAAAASGIINVLRTALSLRQVELKGSDAIEVWDTPQRVALAEQVIASLDKNR